MIGQKSLKQETVLIIYIICYFIVNLYTLKVFPFVHSDESWLSGLTRNMMETGNLGVTETFYDLKPRFPHAIKMLFHLMQMPFLAVFGYQVLSFRLLSLFFGCGALILFYFLLKLIFCRKGDESANWYPLLGTLLLSADIQFIYASHFARQEIILVFCLVACLYFLLQNKVIQAGIVTGLAIGVHPNSFLVGTMCLAILVPFGVEKKFPKGSRSQWKPLGVYTGVAAAFAGVFVSISLFFDKGFLSHYLEYGSSEFDIGAPVTSKLAEVPVFIQKIWLGVSGTYHVPDIKLELILFGITMMTAVVLIITGKKRNGHEIRMIVKGTAGMAAGMVLIGRYNQTSIVFLFPLLFLLFLLVTDTLAHSEKTGGKWVRSIPVGLLILALAASSWNNIKPWLNYSYDEYLGELATVVKPEDKVLGNLNSEYYFDNGKLLDYRNLSYLKEAGLTVGEYVKRNEIEYIILSDEMDFIYSQRPVWNIIYGNLRYMEELNAFIQENCTLVHRFDNNTYGVRIVQYINSDRDFAVKIYKVKNLIGE